MYLYIASDKAIQLDEEEVEGQVTRTRHPVRVKDLQAKDTKRAKLLTPIGP